jgi:hypothetical protein
LPYAVLIAHDAERKFNPRLGYDFSTFLRWHLRGLHRHCKKEYRNRGIYLSRDWEKKPSDRQRALVKYGGRINWNEHRPALINLEQRQGQSLRLVEKATLDWMIEPDGRTLPQVAAWIGCTKGYASKVRYKLLHKIHSHLQTV